MSGRRQKSRSARSFLCHRTVLPYQDYDPLRQVSPVRLNLSQTQPLMVGQEASQAISRHRIRPSGHISGWVRRRHHSPRTVAKHTARPASVPLTVPQPGQYHSQASTARYHSPAGTTARLVPYPLAGTHTPIPGTYPIPHGTTHPPRHHPMPAP